MGKGEIRKIRLNLHISLEKNMVLSGQLARLEPMGSSAVFWRLIVYFCFFLNGGYGFHQIFKDVCDTPPVTFNQGKYYGFIALCPFQA